MLRLAYAFAAAALSWAAVGAESASSETYPSRYVAVIGQTATGSGPDVILRIVADRLSKRWKQKVAVFNRQGAAGLVAAQVAASAKADGYTLYMPTSTAVVILPETHSQLPVDFARDFVPVGLIGETPMAIAVSSTLGINSLEDFIAAAKARPGKMFYAANNSGSFPHLTGAYLNRFAGIDVTFVPYAGVTAALQDVLGGRIHMIIESISALAAAVQDGSIKLLAVTASTRLANYPDVPLAANTMPEFVVNAWFALLAPAGTPDEVVQKVAADLALVLDEPELRQKFELLGFYPRVMSPLATGDYMRREQAAWRPIIKEVGLSAR